MTTTAEKISGSHRTTVAGDRIKIHDLELFVGFDWRFDKDDSKVRKYDADKIRNVVAVTRKYAQRGQNALNGIRGEAFHVPQGGVLWVFALPE